MASFTYSGPAVTEATVNMLDVEVTVTGPIGPNAAPLRLYVPVPPVPVPKEAMVVPTGIPAPEMTLLFSRTPDPAVTAVTVSLLLLKVN
jgi:hypothetical protein